MDTAPAVVPFCIIPKSSKRALPDSLLKLNWFIRVEPGKSELVPLARPTHDKFKDIFAVWDPVHHRLFYTDTDLAKTRVTPTLAGMVKWWVLQESWPYYAHGFWRRQHKEPGQGSDTCLIVYEVGKDGVRYAKLRDGRRNFFARQTWEAGKPPPPTVQWKPSTYESPFRDDRNDEEALDRRMAFWVSDLKCAFMVDSAFRRILYWHTASRQWKEYEGLTPGWGPYIGAPWQRAGVHRRGRVFHWRDPVTLILYRLLPDKDYHNIAELWWHSKDRRTGDILRIVQLSGHFTNAVQRLERYLGESQRALEVPNDNPGAVVLAQPASTKPQIPTDEQKARALAAAEALAACVDTFDTMVEHLSGMADYPVREASEPEEAAGQGSDTEQAAGQDSNAEAAGQVSNAEAASQVSNTGEREVSDDWEQGGLNTRYAACTLGVPAGSGPESDFKAVDGEKGILQACLDWVQLCSPKHLYAYRQGHRLLRPGDGREVQDIIDAYVDLYNDVCYTLKMISSTLQAMQGHTAKVPKINSALQVLQGHTAKAPDTEEELLNDFGAPFWSCQLSNFLKWEEVFELPAAAEGAERQWYLKPCSEPVSSRKRRAPDRVQERDAGDLPISTAREMDHEVALGPAPEPARALGAHPRGRVYSVRREEPPLPAGPPQPPAAERKGRPRPRVYMQPVPEEEPAAQPPVGGAPAERTGRPRPRVYAQPVPEEEPAAQPSEGGQAGPAAERTGRPKARIYPAGRPGPRFPAPADQAPDEAGSAPAEEEPAEDDSGPRQRQIFPIITDPAFHLNERVNVSNRVWVGKDRDGAPAYQYWHYGHPWKKFELAMDAAPLEGVSWKRTPTAADFYVEKFNESLKRQIIWETQREYQQAEALGTRQHGLRFCCKVGLGPTMEFNPQSSGQNVFQGDYPCGVRIYPINDQAVRLLGMRQTLAKNVVAPEDKQQERQVVFEAEQKATDAAVLLGLPPPEPASRLLITGNSHAPSARRLLNTHALGAGPDEAALDGGLRQGTVEALTSDDVLAALPSDIDHAKWQNMVRSLQGEDLFPPGFTACRIAGEEGGYIAVPSPQEISDNQLLLWCIQTGVLRALMTGSQGMLQSTIDDLNKMSATGYKGILTKELAELNRWFRGEGQLPDAWFQFVPESDDLIFERWQHILETKKAYDRYAFGFYDAYILSALFNLRIRFVLPAQSDAHTFQDPEDENYLVHPNQTAAPVDIVIAYDERTSPQWVLLVPLETERLYECIRRYRSLPAESPASANSTPPTAVTVYKGPVDNGQAPAAVRPTADGKDSNQESGVANAKKIVKEQDGNAARAYKGSTPAFALTVHEQPWNNYSFFSACRDAAAAILELPLRSVPNLYSFVYGWLTHLEHPPAGLCDSIRNHREVITTRQPNADVDRILKELVAKIQTSLKEQQDLRITEADLLVLALAGVPSQACFPRVPPPMPEFLQFRFLLCTEADNQLQLGEKWIPNTTGPVGMDVISVPLLRITPGSFQYSDGRFTRGEDVCNYYHLLCSPDPAQLKPEVTREEEGEHGLNACPLPMGARLGVFGDDPRAPRNILQITNGPGETSVEGGGQLVINQSTTSETRMVLRPNSNGEANARLVPVSASDNLAIVVKQLTPNGALRTVQHDSPLLQTSKAPVAEQGRHDRYVTNVGVIPRMQYFTDLLEQNPAGLNNHLPLLPSIDSKKLMVDFHDGNTNPRYDPPSSFVVGTDQHLPVPLGPYVFPSDLGRFEPRRYPEEEEGQGIPEAGQSSAAADINRFEEVDEEEDAMSSGEPGTRAKPAQGQVVKLAAALAAASKTDPGRARGCSTLAEALKTVRMLRAALEGANASEGMHFEPLDEPLRLTLDENQDAQLKRIADKGRMIDDTQSQAEKERALLQLLADFLEFLKPFLVDAMATAVYERERIWIGIWNTRRQVYQHPGIPLRFSSQGLFREGEEYPDPQYGPPVLDKKFPFITAAQFDADATRAEFRRRAKVWLTHVMDSVKPALKEKIFFSDPHWADLYRHTAPTIIWKEYAVVVKRYLNARVQTRRGDGMHFEALHDRILTWNSDSTLAGIDEAVQKEDLSKIKAIVLGQVVTLLRKASEQRERFWIDEWNKRIHANSQERRLVDETTQRSYATPQATDRPANLYRPGEEYPDARYGDLAPGHYFLTLGEFTGDVQSTFVAETEAVLRDLATEAFADPTIQKLLANDQTTVQTMFNVNTKLKGPALIAFYSHQFLSEVYNATEKKFEDYLTERAYRSYMVMDLKEDIREIVAVLKGNAVTTLTAPCNLVLLKLLQRHSFVPASRAMQWLTDVCHDSFQANPSRTPVNWDELPEAISDALPKVSSFQYRHLMEMGLTCSIKLDHAMHQAPTLDVLKILARVYSSERERSPADLRSMKLPYINFVVVRHNHWAGQPHQLEVVLHSDPRGLQLAMTINEHPTLLPTFSYSDSTSGRRPEPDDNALRDHIRETSERLHQVYAAHQLAKIAVILMDGDAFYLLNAQPAITEPLERFETREGPTFPFNASQRLLPVFEQNEQAMMSAPLSEFYLLPTVKSQAFGLKEGLEYVPEKYFFLAPKNLSPALYNILKSNSPEIVVQLIRQKKLRLFVFRLEANDSKDLVLDRVIDGRTYFLNPAKTDWNQTHYCIQNLNKDEHFSLLIPAKRRESGEEMSRVRREIEQRFNLIRAKIQLYLTLVDNCFELMVSLGIHPRDILVQFPNPKWSVINGEREFIPGNLPGCLSAQLWHDGLKKLPVLAVLGTQNVAEMLKVTDISTSFLYLLKQLVARVLPNLLKELRRYLVNTTQLYEQRDEDFEYNPRLRFNLTHTRFTRDDLLHERQRVVSYHMERRLLAFQNMVTPLFTSKVTGLQEELMRVYSLSPMTSAYYLRIIVNQRKCDYKSWERLKLLLSEEVKTFYSSKTYDNTWSPETFTATPFLPMLPFYDADSDTFYLVDDINPYAFQQIREHLDAASQQQSFIDSATQRMEAKKSTAWGVASDELARFEKNIQDYRKQKTIQEEKAASLFTQLETSGSFRKYVYDMASGRFRYKELDQGQIHLLEQEIQALENQILSDKQAILTLQEEQSTSQSRLEQEAFHDHMMRLKNQISAQEASIVDATTELTAKQSFLAILRDRSNQTVDDRRLDGCSLRFDESHDRWEWTSGENHQLYYLADKPAGITNAYENYQRWEIQLQPPPTLDRPTATFPTLWYDPINHQLVCLDYMRRTWVSKYTDPNGTANDQRDDWQMLPDKSPNGKFYVVNKFVQVDARTPFDSIPGIVEGHLGLHRDHFTAKIPRRGAFVEDLPGPQKQRGNLEYFVHSVVVRTERDEDNTADDYDMPSDDEAEEDVEPEKDPIGVTFLEPTYSHMCFFNSSNGILKNPFGIDYGLTGRPGSQDPNSKFRQACIYAELPATPESESQLKVAYRVPTPLDLDPQRLIPVGKSGKEARRGILARPYWKNTCNVERYWGANPEVPALRAKLIQRAKRHPNREIKRGKLVNTLETHEVYANRARMFFHWITDTRNWYWDKNGKRFVVFCYSPHLVWVHPEDSESMLAQNQRIVQSEEGPSSWLVQELLMYEVDPFFHLPDAGEAQGQVEEKDETDSKEREAGSQEAKTKPPPSRYQMIKKECAEYLTQRFQAETQWHELEKGYKNALGSREERYNNINASVITWSKKAGLNKHLKPKALDPTKFFPSPNMHYFSDSVLAGWRASKRAMLDQANRSKLMMDYYSKVTRRFVDKADTHKLWELGGGANIPLIMSDRQKANRSLFLSLFADKFGRPYCNFLLDDKFRARVYSMAPEFMGPGLQSAQKSHFNKQDHATIVSLFNERVRERPDAFGEVFRRLHPPTDTTEPEEWKFTEPPRAKKTETWRYFDFNPPSNLEETLEYMLTVSNVYPLYEKTYEALTAADRQDGEEWYTLYEESDPVLE